MSITPPRAPPDTLTITQLCRQVGATQRALRFYEEKGLLSPERRNRARLYSRRDQVRLRLILRGRRIGFTLEEIRQLLETYDKGGRAAQLVRALPLFKERLAALELKRREIDDALEALTRASESLLVRLGATIARPARDGPPRCDVPPRASC
jgi:DNA-binding transcriptional MerR regulator